MKLFWTKPSVFSLNAHFHSGVLLGWVNRCNCTIQFWEKFNWTHQYMLKACFKTVARSHGRYLFRTKFFFFLVQVGTCLRVQELKKLCFYLLSFLRYEAKSKFQPILTYFFKTYNCPLCFYGSTQCIHIFRDT